MNNEELKTSLKFVRDALQSAESEIQTTLEYIDQYGDDSVAACMDNVDVKTDDAIDAIKKLFRSWRKPHCQHQHWATEAGVMTCTDCGSTDRADYDSAWDRWFSGAASNLDPIT
jgi:hypothetical protein